MRVKFHFLNSSTVVRSQRNAAELQDFLRFVEGRLPRNNAPTSQQWMTETRGTQIEQYPGWFALLMQSIL